MLRMPDQIKVISTHYLPIRAHKYGGLVCHPLFDKLQLPTQANLSCQLSHISVVKLVC